ncbi:MAG: NADH-quinone oxidoreductase subunit M, partial [Novosphingobium sp.]|nr:NADH-quinone oxidoreductase subunit M [Novosphingobium sp.]
HVQAPTAGSIILAGVLLKMGGYGFIRFSLPMFPDASAQFMWLVFALSMVAVVYTSLVALVQHDMKKLIAYSSVAHMGIVTAGAFAFNVQGLEGSMIMMLSHGLVSGALFLAVGIIYDRLHTREIDRYGGLSINMPRYALFFMLFTMASIGLPGTSGFIAEFLSIAGIYQMSTWVAFVCTTGIILGAAYMLYLYRRVAFGEQKNADAAAMSDLDMRELALVVPLALAVLWMGIYPESFLKPMRQDIAALNARIAHAAPDGDSRLKVGKPKAEKPHAAEEHGEAR